MIIDADRDSHDRSAPNPNRHDQMSHEAIMSKGTNSTNYITPASNQSTLLGAKNGQFTIVQVGTFTTTATYNTTAPGVGSFAADTFNIYQAPHNLGFLPGMIAYELSGTGQYSPMPYFKYQVGSSTQALWYNFLIFVDTTNVYMQLNTLTAGNASFSFNPGFIFKWYLTQQTSN